jgi:hypothetical protein
MTEPPNPKRRSLVKRLAIGVSLAPLAALNARAADVADLPALAEGDPAAAAVQYVEDASRATSARAGANCASCSAYTGANGDRLGICALFPGKSVRAAGWCSAWTDM